ncbi:MOSC domain [Proteiniborus ethanoligenes]|uniref:MOSC domain n=1 Tax=Proteiniborus ethanoligenes TaxID=415015 RepID=A0A1H3NKG9_9FIRM|nr:hypothetical protein [Proteiniborus ethanoligenes]SDY88709.1 MOSC domain [Proteiniborus ethanoligenes]
MEEAQGKYNLNGQVVDIWISKEKGTPRVGVREALLKENHGIVGDVNSGDNDRQVTLLTKECREKVKKLNLKGLCTDRFHENITVENIDLCNLYTGQRICLGETVHEITQIGKKCFSECNIVKNGETCPLSREVVFTKVIKGGVVKKGDIVYKKEVAY